MLYMILSNPHLNMSVYLTCRNDALRMKSIRAATYGESWPGVSLALGHVPYDRWVKYVWKLILYFLLLTLAFLVVGSWLG